jgi:hypothetical protein
MLAATLWSSRHQPVKYLGDVEPIRLELEQASGKLSLATQLSSHKK